MDDQSNNPAFNSKPAPVSNDPRTFKSEDLFQGRKEIHILHGEEVYKMRITRNGKLIMTK